MSSIVKAALVFLVALINAAFSKDEPIRAGLIELHGEHAVLVAGSQSADGRYAAGWTVRPKKGQVPVKWENFEKEDNRFREDYVWNDEYVVTNVVVDLARRAIVVTLPFSDPYFGGKNHGGLHTVFGPEREKRRFAMVLSDGKWNPHDAVLVDLEGDRAIAVDILKVLNSAVDKYIAGQSNAKKRLNPEDYATDYRLFELPEIGLLTGFSDAETVRIPFTSEVPKAADARAFAGTILLRLSRDKSGPHADAGEVREYDKDPDPTQDDPRVAAADKELNTAYTAARNALNAAGKTKLLEEQRAWIKERDERLSALHLKHQETPIVANPRIEMDRLLLQLTQERTAALRK
jgi:uncharacterized protein YecT (DUF1311 family)